MTPLHTAAVYERLDVFEYLAAKFPETLRLIDFHGWTPMDYVSTLPDKTFLQQLLNTEISYEVCTLYVYVISLFQIKLKTINLIKIIL